VCFTIITSCSGDNLSFSFFSLVILVFSEFSQWIRIKIPRKVIFCGPKSYQKSTPDGEQEQNVTLHTYVLSQLN
jgi:hypothetical protein